MFINIVQSWLIFPSSISLMSNLQRAGIYSSIQCTLGWPHPLETIGLISASFHPCRSIFPDLTMPPDRVLNPCIWPPPPILHLYYKGSLEKQNKRYLSVDWSIGRYEYIYEYYEELVHRIMELRSPMICGLKTQERQGCSSKALRGREPMV